MERKLGNRTKRGVMTLGMKRNFNKGRLAMKKRGMDMPMENREMEREEDHSNGEEMHNDDERKDNMEKKRRRK